MKNKKKDFTHLSENNLPRMVDITEKSKTTRKAKSVAKIHLGKELTGLLQKTKHTKKGPVIETAVIAGIQGAKKTSEIIPMCHQVNLNGVEIDINFKDEYLIINVAVKTNDRTGVEMEALTAASVAALTIYDMCKSVSKNMTIESIHLIEKTGGKSGNYYK